MDSFSPTPSFTEGMRSQHGVMGTERKETVDKRREGGGDVCMFERVGWVARCGFPHFKEREGGT